MGHAAAGALEEAARGDSGNPRPLADRPVMIVGSNPAARALAFALKERGACSIGKDVGLCASDIEPRVHLSQPTISHHMSILTKAGLVEAKKLGQWMWYRRNETALREFARELRESL